jgi:hypothetical protein
MSIRSNGDNTFAFLAILLEEVRLDFPHLRAGHIATGDLVWPMLGEAAFSVLHRPGERAQ